MRKVDYIVIHCTAGPQDQTTKAIKDYWKSLGWSKVGYHKLISADGSYEVLSDDENPTNGVKGYNSNSVHICYKGGVKDGKPFDTRTEAQKSTMLALVEMYMDKYSTAVVRGHRDFSPDKNRDGVVSPNEWMKACPSFSVTAWLRENGY